MTEPGKPLLNPVRAAEIVGVSRSSLIRWAEQGHVHGTHTPNGWRFTEAEIRRFAASLAAGGGS